MADTNSELGSYLRKDGEEKLIGGVSKYKGRDYFSFRCWYKGDNDTWAPGKNGVNLSMDEADNFLGVVIQTFGIAKVKEILDQFEDVPEGSITEGQQPPEAP